MKHMTMPSIRHHLTDPLLMAYSAGTLPEAFNLVVAVHVSLCDECRARLMAFDAVGGALIDSLDFDDEVEMSMEAGLAAAMSRIDAPEETVPEVARPVATDVPAPLADYIGGGLASVRWRGIGNGVGQAILPTSSGARVRLLRIPGGTAVPDHGHRGTELTLVLKGAFRDETDRFGPGDVEVADEEMVHQPVAEAGEDCICLAATDAPLRFRSLMPRIAQPFLRI